MRSYRLISAAIWSCLLLPVSGYSEPSSGEDYTELSLKELMALEVFTSTSMLPTEIKKAPGTVYSFNRKDFLRLGVRTIDELLDYVPGLQLNQYKKHHRSVWARGVIDRYNNKLKFRATIISRPLNCISVDSNKRGLFFPLESSNSHQTKHTD